MKKEVDPVTKGKEQKPSQDKEPRKGVREFSEDSAQVETECSRVAMNCANVQDASGKGWEVRLVFHMVFWDCLPCSPRHKPRGDGEAIKNCAVEE